MIPPSSDDRPEATAANRELLAKLLDRVEARLSEKGRMLFHWLFVDERSIEEICELAEMNPDAVYAWRSRLRKLARELHEELCEAPAVKEQDRSAKPMSKERP